MGDLIDFNKVKESSDKKKSVLIKRKKKNTKLVKKYRRIDEGRKIRPLYFYIGIIVLLIILKLANVF